MTKTEEIVKKLDAMYENPKSKGFVNHMIKSYSYLKNVNKVDNSVKSLFTCSLTNKRLASMSEVAKMGLSEDEIKSFDFDLMSMVKGQKESTTFTNEYKGKRLAFTSNETTTFISYEALVGLLAWIDLKLEAKDKNIYWLVNSVKPRKSELEIRGYKKPTTTLGELDSLKKLKAQFEKKGF
jgi:hypothetical protein